MIYHDTQTIVIIIILLHTGMSYFWSILQNPFSTNAVPNGKIRTKILFLKNKRRIDLGMACVTPPLKKAKKEGEMPLPSLGLISLKNLGTVVKEEEEEEFFFSGLFLSSHVLIGGLYISAPVYSKLRLWVFL